MASREACWSSAKSLTARGRPIDFESGPATLLSGMLLQHFGVPQAQGLIHEVYNTNLKPAAIGALAQCVQAAFSQGDHVAIVTYAGASGLRLPATNGDRKNAINAAIDSLNAGGSTNGSAGILLAVLVEAE